MGSTDPVNVDRPILCFYAIDRPIRYMWIDRSKALRAPHAQTSFSLLFTHSPQ
uniref:Uncharacterized protein n=1 Tax=Brassica oleracea var. oleracea TaxID=109376 RepID=A0A0D3DG70_BRAOL